MGGRGSSSGTAGGMGSARRRREERVQRGHLMPEEVPKTPEATAAYLGVSVEQAKELYGSVNAYTGYQYKDIRAAQRGELDSEHYRRMASNLETYIGEAPKWAGGTTYREKLSTIIQQKVHMRAGGKAHSVMPKLLMLALIPPMA